MTVDRKALDSSDNHMQLTKAIAQPSGDSEAAGEALLVRLYRRALWATPVVLLVSYLLTWAILLAPDPNRLIVQSDFVSTITGARIIGSGDGQHLYDLATQLAAQKSIRTPYMGDEDNALLPYMHLPFEALLLVPFAGLTYWVPYFLWAGALALALFLALRLLRHTLPLPGLSRVGAVLVLVSIAYGPAFRSFRLGQNSPLILLGLCGVYVAARRHSDSLAGVYLLLVALKPQMLPIVLLALLAVGRWRAVLWFAGLFCLACVAVMPVLGAQWPLQYLDVLAGVASLSDANGVHPAVMHNWRGFATDTIGWFAPRLVTPLITLLSAATLSALALVWWKVRRALWAKLPLTLPSVRDTGEKASLLPTFDMVWALVGLSAVLVSPHLNPHDLTLLIFPGWIIAAYVVNGRTVALSGSKWVPLLGLHYLLLSIGLSVFGNVATVPLSVGILAVALVWLAKETLHAAEKLACCSRQERTNYYLGSSQ